MNLEPGRSVRVLDPRFAFFPIRTFFLEKPMSAPPGLIESYVEGAASVRRAVSGLTRDQLVARPIAGTWSILEVVCHLVDSEQAWCHRMKRVIAEPRPLVIGYDESRFAGAIDYQERDLESELHLLEEMRRQMAQILRKVPDAAWSFTGVHNERGLMTLEDMLRAEAEHIPHHLGFVAEKRKALGLPIQVS
jgi:uncharacterized damage-inducible protein DinB